MKKNAILPALCAALCLVCASGCASTQESSQPKPTQHVSATPDSPTAASDTQAASATAPSSATQPATTAKKSKAKVNTITPSRRVPNTISPTAPTVDPANIPPNSITGANINPNINSIAGRISDEISSRQVTAISLSKTEIELEVGEKAEIEIAYQPSDAMYKLCSVSGGNECAQISATNNTVTVKGRSAGTCVITVTSQNGHKATCSITVKRNEEITDDSKITYEDLYTAENVGRLSEEMSAVCASLGMERNAQLKGADIAVNTADNKGRTVSYNEVKAEYTQSIKTQLAVLTAEGDYKDYVYNCYTEPNGSDYFINIVISKKEE